MAVDQYWPHRFQSLVITKLDCAMQKERPQIIRSIKTIIISAEKLFRLIVAQYEFIVMMSPTNYPNFDNYPFI